MTKNTITKKECFAAIVTMMETGACPVDKDIMIEFANKEIAALERKAAKAKETAAKKRAEGDELKTAVAAVLTDEPQLIADITAAVTDVVPDASVAKVSYRLRQLEKEGTAEKTSVNVGETGKKRTLVAYKAA